MLELRERDLNDGRMGGIWLSSIVVCIEIVVALATPFIWVYKRPHSPRLTKLNQGRRQSTTVGRSSKSNPCYHKSMFFFDCFSIARPFLRQPRTTHWREQAPRLATTALTWSRPTFTYVNASVCGFFFPVCFYFAALINQFGNHGSSRAEWK